MISPHLPLICSWDAQHSYLSFSNKVHACFSALVPSMPNYALSEFWLSLTPCSHQHLDLSLCCVLQSCVGWLAKHALLAWPTKAFAQLPAKIRLEVRAKVKSVFCQPGCLAWQIRKHDRCDNASVHIQSMSVRGSVSLLSHSSGMSLASRLQVVQHGYSDCLQSAT